MGPIFLQFLISDPWNKGQFGYTTIQTGQYFPRKLIKRWNVIKSMGLAPVNIFKTINVSCPILSVSVSRKNPRPLLGSAFLERNWKGESGLGGMLGRNDRYFLFELPTRPSPFYDILPGLCSGSTSLFIHRTMGPIFLQFLISDPWNKGQFGYTTNLSVEHQKGVHAI